MASYSTSGKVTNIDALNRKLRGTGYEVVKQGNKYSLVNPQGVTVLTDSLATVEFYTRSLK